MKETFKINRLTGRMPKTLRPSSYDMMQFMSGNNKKQDGTYYVRRAQIDAMKRIIEREAQNALAFLENEASKMVGN